MFLSHFCSVEARLLLHPPCLLSEVLPDSVVTGMKTSDDFEYFNVLQSTINDKSLT